VYWRARDSESGNSKPDAMNVIDTRQKILDAVDANFDTQLAATKGFVAIPSTRGHVFFESAHGGRQLPAFKQCRKVADLAGTLN
jgi:hypothetical protein